MRIAVHGNAVYQRSAYGIQGRQLLERLQADGHEVAMFAYSGLNNGSLPINGIPHFGLGQLGGSQDVFLGHCARFGPDLVITLQDLHAGPQPEVWAWLTGHGVKVWHWFPVDCEPLGAIDAAILKVGGGRPVAMSRFGQRQLELAGFDPAYVPHSVDTKVFTPRAGNARDTARSQMGYSGLFVTAVCASNKEAMRKGWFECLEGWAAFHAKHPDSRLLIHAEQSANLMQRGEAVQFDFGEWAGVLGLTIGTDPADCPAVQMTEDYVVKTGMMDEHLMAGWYSLADVYLCASWAEGFCVPLIEAAASGVPLIGTDCSAVTELVRGSGGWLVKSEAKFNPVHKRRWRAPLIQSITWNLEKAHSEWKAGKLGPRQRQARTFAMSYDADRVYDEYWRPLIKGAEAG